MGDLSDILEVTEAERLATGCEFTEGPLWHPDGFYYFVDIRRSTLHQLAPSRQPEIMRSNIDEGNARPSTSKADSSSKKAAPPRPPAGPSTRTAKS